MLKKIVYMFKLLLIYTFKTRSFVKKINFLVKNIKNEIYKLQKLHKLAPSYVEGRRGPLVATKNLVSKSVG